LPINRRSSADMHTLQTAIAIAWIIFWIYWLASAVEAKKGAAGRRRFPLPGLSVLSVLLAVRVFRGGSLAVHSPVLGAIGTVVFASGIALAIWARLHLGRNWGMPMTQKAEPELVTSGPYRFVRHPIYTGLLAGLLGTALANNLIGLIVVAILGVYFYYAASVEEKNLTATFPTAYPAYQTSTKMLIPFVL
jgi:protein-S-isoprenylcysteine O-methyltransferase Ste14